MALPLIFTAAAFPAIAATIIKYMVGYAIVRVISALGIALITFQALDLITAQIESFIVNNVTSIGGQFWEVAVHLNAPHAIKVVTSAYIGAALIRQAMGVYSRVTFGKRSA